MSDGSRDAPPWLADVDIHAPEFAEYYDELPLWSAPFGQMLLDRVPLRPGLAILDVGAGTGFLTLELAQRCGPTATVIAVDPWAAAMRQLERKVARLGLGNVRLLVQDAARIELPDASIDLVVSNLGLNNFENAEAVLQTCGRVLRPDGRLVLTTNLAGHMREFYEVYRATLEALGLREALGALEAHIQHRATLDSLRALLGRAGFAKVEVVTGELRMRFADGSSLLRHALIRAGFMPAWKAVVPPGELTRTFEALERRLNEVAAARGELALTIPMACVDARRVQA